MVTLIHTWRARIKEAGAQLNAAGKALTLIALKEDVEVFRGLDSQLTTLSTVIPAPSSKPPAPSLKHAEALQLAVGAIEEQSRSLRLACAHPRMREATAAALASDADDMPKLPRGTFPPDRSDLTFNNDIGALRAVEHAVLDAIEGDAPFASIAPLADRVRRFLVGQRLARRRPDRTPAVGGKRKLPRRIWSSLRALSSCPKRPTLEKMKEVNGHGWVMLIYADAIHRADKSWQTWDHHRRERARREVVPDPDPAWRYPRSRSLYLSIWNLYSDLYLLEEELKDAARKPLAKFWYRTPELTANDAAWAVMLAERWQYQVNEAYTIKYDYGVLDDYHTRLDAACCTIHKLKAATTAAAPELDDGEPNVVRRFTTRFIRVLDRIEGTLPSVMNEGMKLPPEPEQRAARIRESVTALAKPAAVLRALAYQRSEKSSAPPPPTGGRHQSTPADEQWRLPSGAELVKDVEISMQKFRRIRKAAGIDRGERGAKARQRRYEPQEVAALIEAVLRLGVMRCKDIAEAWKTYASANPMDDGGAVEATAKRQGTPSAK